MVKLRLPVATYRLQFNKQLGFAEARILAPYLQALGISDLYASPLTAAREKSPHGYDVIDPTRLNPQLGDKTAFTAFVTALQQHGLGLLLDFVPNHMAASSENQWWQDVLRYGPSSARAAFFDIDWQPVRPGLAGKILLPVLGKPFAKVLENGELGLILAAEGFQVCYHEQRFPLAPATCIRLLQNWAEKNPGIPAAGQAIISHLTELLAQLQQQANRETRHKLATACRQAWHDFWRLLNEQPGLKDSLDNYLESFNGRRGEPQSFNRLEQLLAEQPYRLSFWRLASTDINYRRFFDVSDLVSLRMEDEQVFNATHTLIYELIAKRQVTGLRLDHIDGLHDPEKYLLRLQERLGGSGNRPAFYVIVEKILAGEEELPDSWPVFGTTGYDFLNILNRLFIDSEGLTVLDRLYASCSNGVTDFATIVYQQKKLVMRELFGSEVRNLVRQLVHLAAKNRYGQDLTLAELEQALVEISACLAVYRTYIRNFKLSSSDRNYIEAAVREAVSRQPAVGPACAFLRQVLLLQFPAGLPEEQQQEWLAFVMRWQQFTGPVMAKGFEDTSLYLYNRLVSLNEVGSEPEKGGVTTAAFHRFNLKRQQRWPYSLNATSTHDSKRSEDVRARINVLSEIAPAWEKRLKQWQLWNLSRKRKLWGRPVPEGNTEVLLYQTLIGAWPLVAEELPSFKERLHGYLLKAVREAKRYSSWLAPEETYEQALAEFADTILEPGAGNHFLVDFIEFQKTTAFYGAINSLAQVLLKITCPGIPDLYQGMELWNFSLVDPDNRRPVDFAARIKLLNDLQEGEKKDQQVLVKNLLSSWEDGRIKLYLTYKALQFRKKQRDLFASGAYLPLTAQGSEAEHVCSFARQLQDNWVLVLVPRLSARLQMKCQEKQSEQMPPLSFPLGGEVWKDTALLLPAAAPDRWRNILTGEVISACQQFPVAALLKYFPVALLVGVPLKNENNSL
ncbi:MAG: malto-oligosyltrehalose synthase [Clostridia bacterium]|nr:malto-oligosyltrehalose synthase [Clostridia bacterium]